ncbi:hypothetical protein HAX54_022409 [Datura stramonium]|uniref:Uncharacterized protein n=1 Tax=Datura stramonium TaxID=4076 RepID=A0ABS8RKD3_DATST|nr:hypothetical protein [Datura stramonium]
MVEVMGHHSYDGPLSLLSRWRWSIAHLMDHRFPPSPPAPDLKLEVPLLQEATLSFEVSMANPVAQVNLPPEEMTEAQRAEAMWQVEEAQLADVARRADAANFIAPLQKGTDKTLSSSRT